MRLATRTFLTIFLPLASLLGGSFWALRISVLQAVKDDLRESVRKDQKAREAERARDEATAAQLLASLSENSALKAGLQTLLANPATADARRTLEGQLGEMASSLHFDLLSVSANGHAEVSVLFDGHATRPIQGAPAKGAKGGFFAAEGHLYQLASGPVNQGEEYLGELTIGQRFDLGRFDTPVVLMHNGTAIDSSAKIRSSRSLDAMLMGCSPTTDCEIAWNGETYFSAPLESSKGAPPGDDYVLRTLQNIDRAVAPMSAGLRNVFSSAGLVALAAALGISFTSSRSIIRPIAQVVETLKTSERTGVLPQFQDAGTGILEIKDLEEGIHRASMAIAAGRFELVRAYVEFTGSLANALDARDPYTAGHSRRVADYSCAIARTMGISGEAVDHLRIGALLHDVGKIGISDSVLQKPGRLTAEEEALIRRHPVIGRRILEGVNGFQNYLNVVELHHENWDGTGYPHGLKGEQTPLDARIVKVADAYDAMTSDRPYRRGISHEQAVAHLRKAAGTQFDGPIVEAFAASDPPPSGDSLRNLSEAIAAQARIQNPAPREVEPDRVKDA
jgi:putative nucleotidyltransferase with HDIG domain